MLGSPYRLIVSLNLDRHEILVAGGGLVGERKISTLLSSGARVRLISPAVTGGLGSMAAKGEIIWERREIDRGDFKEHRFAILALPRDILDNAVMMARSENCAVDACSNGDAGDFALCAQFDMEDCRVGVSSGGNDPAKAAGVKRSILKGHAETHLGGNPNGSAFAADGFASYSTGSMPAMHKAALPVVLTRSSPLALAQTEQFVGALAMMGVTAVCRSVTSHGDSDKKKDLVEFGGFGAFVKKLEDELLEGKGDFAVHSMKDMPINLPSGCVIAAVLPRESTRDVLITKDGRGLDSLSRQAVIGTSSLRRRAQVRRYRRDVKCVKCRGNVGTRLNRLERGEVDALILAEAGLSRLGLNLKYTAELPFITAAGQGAIAIETRSGSWMEGAARELNHFETWCEIIAEREVLRLMELGCACPIGIRGKMREGVMELAATVYSVEPKEDPEDECASLRLSGPVGSDEDAKALACRLWNEMRELPLMVELAALSERFRQ